MLNNFFTKKQNKTRKSWQNEKPNEGSLWFRQIQTQCNNNTGLVFAKFITNFLKCLTNIN